MFRKRTIAFGSFAAASATDGVSQDLQTDSTNATLNQIGMKILAKMNSREHRTLLGILVLLTTLPLGATACTKVEPGYVGIKVNNWGSQKGVQDYPLKTGMVFYNPLTEDMYDFPTFMVTRTWTQSTNEGNPIDESITFNSIEGTQVNADVAITYFFDPHKVPEIFVKFRAKPDVLTDGYIHNRVRDFLNREASDMRVVDIFGQGKQKILNSVKHDLEAELGPIGIHFDSVSFTSALRVDQSVHDSINRVIQAAQDALAAQNKVVQAKAEADQVIATAQGAAQATLINAKAQADANQLLNSSLTPTLVQWQAIQKWNGNMPNVTGGAMPFIDVTPKKQ
jgi:regulator of protease activity HflC (stomatin/prohibitin superfamily)